MVSLVSIDEDSSLCSTSTSTLLISNLSCLSFWLLPVVVVAQVMSYYLVRMCRLAEERVQVTIHSCPPDLTKQKGIYCKYLDVNSICQVLQSPLDIAENNKRKKSIHTSKTNDNNKKKTTAGPMTFTLCVQLYSSNNTPP